MRSHEKLASPFAALTSLALHALLLASGLTISTRASLEPRPLPQDAWAARGVEVGTIPDAPPKAPAAEPATERPSPLPAPEPPLPKTEEAALSLPKSTDTAPPLPKAADAAPERPKAEDAAPPLPRAAVVRPRRPSKTPRATASVSSAPSDARATASPPSADASQASAGVETAGSIGAVGLPPGVRHLATAFTRALPAGGYKDAAWSELPLGKVGDAIVSLHLTNEGRLEDVEVEPAHGLAPALDHMIRRVVLLLKSGTFSLDPRKVSGGGMERLELEVTLSTRPANPDELAAPGDLFAQSFAPPKLDQPGYARFTLNSGRHVEAVVRFADPRAPK